MTARIAVLLLALVLPTVAQAQLFRAYLSIDGSDANPCTLQQPCRLLPAALNAVASGGEIWILDSANYNSGEVTIGKSVSILAVPGVVGSFVTTSTAALKITADNLKVSLRNLVIVPLSGAIGSGIHMSGNSELFVENSTIANISGMFYGILVDVGKVRVAGTTFRDIGGYGLALGSGVRASVSSSRFLGGVGGVIVQSNATSRVMVTDSVFQGVSSAIIAIAIGGDVGVVVSRCAIEGASQALYVDAPAMGTADMVLEQSVIMSSTTPYTVQNGATIQTAGNNVIRYNGAPTGSLTAMSLQ
jgi:hypothetical protein